MARALSTRVGCGCHAEATLGAVVTHRAVEGVALATAYLAGSALGLVVGVGAGLATAGTVPGALRSALLAAGGGVLLVVGAAETGSHLVPVASIER